VRSENLRAVRRSLNPEGDTDAPAMLEMMERPASRTGTVFASRPDLTLFRSGATAGEGSGTSGRKAPPVQRPQSGVGNFDPAKDPGRRGVDPEPHRHRGIDLPPFCQHELLGTPLRKGAGELRRLPLGTPKKLVTQKRVLQQRGR
jgi:hypothetical protein